MQINSPTWYLKEQCPCCLQGQPIFIACYSCGHLAAECEEVGTFFPDVSDTSKRCPPADARCSSCGVSGIESFNSASSAQIQSHGFKVGQYE
jgi:hypothetical protein